MTTFAALEASVEGSRPIELYTFNMASQTFRYTSAESDIVFGGNTYSAIAISRSEISIGGDEGKQSLTIFVSAANPVAVKYLAIVPGYRAAVSVIQLQRDELPSVSTAVTRFRGAISSVRFTANGEKAEIAVKSLESAASRNIPRWTYQGSCNNVLYDQFCGVDEDNPAFKFVSTVSIVDENVLTVVGAGAYASDFFAGGFITLDVLDDHRMILAHSGDDITILLPFPVSPLGLTVTLHRGCDHLLDGDCTLVFVNGINYGGCFFIPNKNPFGAGGIG